MSPDRAFASLAQPAHWLVHALAAQLLLTLVAAGCSPAARDGRAPEAGASASAQTVVQHDPPAAAGAMAPHLAVAGGGGAWLSWLEPRTQAEGSGHRLRAARFDGAAWGEPVTVAAGDDFFANWADVPSVVEGADGELLAHWLAKLSGDTYAYGVHLARSTDGGATWQPLGLLHDDASPSEHGFVSLVPAAGGGFDAVWLDGRGMVGDTPPGGGTMSLRAARVTDGVARRETLLDDRVCDCCQTAAVAIPGNDPDGRGPRLLVAYRDRSPDEVRDVSLLRGSLDAVAADGDPTPDAAWSAPQPLHRDGWVIAGCPVNGPALAADGERVAAAWFTGADGGGRVRAALSTDGGAGFGPPLEIDAGAPLGRVGVAFAADGSGDAIVSWLGADGGVWLRRVAGDGAAGAPFRLAVTSTARASGFPRLLGGAAPGAGLWVAWVEISSGEADGRGGASHLRFAEVTLPAAGDATP